MLSFRKLAAERRKDHSVYADHDHDIFKAAVLEIAHALSRGRKPSSCSVLPGQNIQDWLHRTFIKHNPYCMNRVGAECSIADDTNDTLRGWAHNDPKAMAVCRAITICRNYIRPIKHPSQFRGDAQYQNTHPLTNLKRKAAWQQRHEGSSYDDLYDFNFGE